MTIHKLRTYLISMMTFRQNKRVLQSQISGTGETEKRKSKSKGAGEGRDEVQKSTGFHIVFSLKSMYLTFKEGVIFRRRGGSKKVGKVQWLGPFLGPFLVLFLILWKGSWLPACPGKEIVLTINFVFGPPPISLVSQNCDSPVRLHSCSSPGWLQSVVRQVRKREGGFWEEDA